MRKLRNVGHFPFLLAAQLITASTLAFAEPPGVPIWPQNVRVISGVTVGVPEAPNGKPWDTVIGGLLTFNLKNILPDIQICMESTHVPSQCTETCMDAHWSSESNAHVCTQPTGPTGLLLESNMRVVVEEIDPTSKRLVADFMVKNPEECLPCTVTLDGGMLSIRFYFGRVLRYSGPFRPMRDTLPPPPTLPVATPSSNVPDPQSPQPPTVAEVERALQGLRDAENCIGKDDYFPQGTVYIRSQVLQQLGKQQADQLYQMAALATAVSDATAKERLLRSIRIKVGADAYDGVVTLILGDIAQSQTLLAAYQGMVKYFANMIMSKGLAQFLPTFQPVTSLAPDVDHWILKRLLTDQLASRAVDLLFTNHTISAECAFNQLAKEGFMETVVAR